MILPCLPDEMPVPLDAVGAGWTGLTAIVRPLDTVELAQWADGVKDLGQLETLFALVKARLLRLEGAEIAGADGAAVPFDPKQPPHWRAYFSVARDGPMAVRAIADALMARTTLTPAAADF